jgi:hypothetical protein
MPLGEIAVASEVDLVSCSGDLIEPSGGEARPGSGGQIPLLRILRRPHRQHALLSRSGRRRRRRRHRRRPTLVRPSGGGPVTSQRIRATHLSTQVAAEIARAQLDSMLSREAARDRSVTSPSPSSGPRSPSSPGPHRSPSPSRPGRQPALPADSVVLSREEWLAVGHLIDTHPDARTRP